MSDTMQPLPEGAIPLSQHAVTAAIEAWAESVTRDRSIAPGQVVGPRQFGVTSIYVRDRSLYEVPPPMAQWPTRREKWEPTRQER